MEGTYAPETGRDSISTVTILVIDDDAAIGEILVLALTAEMPCHVIWAPNGSDALKRARTFKPQLIFLDYWLPDMDGLSCADLLRSIDGLASTPIFFMSAAPPHQLQERNDFILLEKPFELVPLLQDVKRILAHR
jgi:DNA-binding response OmpR family regulator